MKNQSGKSIVEMLAVLAIMGVLSVTGIMAYHYSMIKHQTNELIHTARLAYVDVISRESMDGVETLNFTQSNGVPLRGFIHNEAGFIIADSIDKPICERLLADKTDFSLLKTNGGAPFVDCSSTNNMIFDFANAGDIGFGCLSDEDCDANTQYCSPNSDTCKNYETCDSANKEVFSKDYDACMHCYDIKIEDTEYTPLYDNGECTACNNQTWYEKEKTCITCPVFSSDIANDNQMGNKPCYCNIDFIYVAESDSCQPTTCETKMISYGYTENYEANETTITYTGDLPIDKDVNLSGCDLIVNGELYVSGSGILTVNDIKATGGMRSTSESEVKSIGISNLGIINATNIQASGKEIGSSSEEKVVWSMGMFNNGTINADTLTATGLKATSKENVHSFGIETRNLSILNIKNKIETYANAATSIDENSYSYSFRNYGTIQNQKNLIIESTVNGTVTADKGDGYSIGLENTSMGKIQNINKIESTSGNVNAHNYVKSQGITTFGLIEGVQDIKGESKKTTTNVGAVRSYGISISGKMVAYNLIEGISGDAEKNSTAEPYLNYSFGISVDKTGELTAATIKGYAGNAITASEKGSSSTGIRNDNKISAKTITGIGGTSNKGKSFGFQNNNTYNRDVTVKVNTLYYSPDYDIRGIIEGYDNVDSYELIPL